MMLQAFGIVRGDHAQPDGRSTPAVRLVARGDLAVAVAEVDDDVELTEDDAARHLDVLIRLLRDGPVLPLAFGTLSPDDEAVAAEIIDPAADDLGLRLDAVDGYVEVRLDVLFDESAALQEVLRVDPELQDLAAQSRADAGLDTRITLGEVVSARLTQWRQERVEQMLPALAGHVDAVAELESREPLEQRWTFLVRGERLAGLDAEVGRLRGGLGEHAAVEYVGPLPVYSFLQEQRVEPAQQRSAWGW